MKRFLIFSLLVLAALSTRAQELRFDQTTHNFGTIDEVAGTVSHTFSFTNQSDKPVVIVSVEVSCGCTTPRFSRKPIASGEVSTVTIEFDPTNRPGRINKKVYVVTNNGNYSLTIDGIVTPRPRSIEERYPFNIGNGARLDGLGCYALQVPIHQLHSCQIGIANTSSGVPVSIGIDHKNLPSSVTATISKELLSANEEAKITITIRGDKYGAFSYRIPLIINGRQISESIAVSGATVDDFSSLDDDELLNGARAKFSTYYHRFGKVAAGKKHTAVVEVTNTGGSPLIIRGIEGSAQVDAKISRTTIAAGATAQITLTYSQSQRGYDSGSIRLVVNDARNPTPEIRFVATVE